MSNKTSQQDLEVKQWELWGTLIGISAMDIDRAVTSPKKMKNAKIYEYEKFLIFLTKCCADYSR